MIYSDTLVSLFNYSYQEAYNAKLQDIIARGRWYVRSPLVLEKE